MQADKTSIVLALAGCAMAELAYIDSALLLVCGEINECIAVNRTGTPGRAASGHDEYRMALERLDSGRGKPAMIDPRTMLAGVPMQRTILESSIATLGIDPNQMKSIAGTRGRFALKARNLPTSLWLLHCPANSSRYTAG